MTPRSEGRLVHHELCFGCGRTNLFGLLAELEQTGPHAVSGRCFIKQDHQGTDPGVAHEGVVVAALSEAMAFACGSGARVREMHVELEASVPVGAFLDLHAEAEGGRASATATTGGQAVATATANFRQPIDG